MSVQWGDYYDPIQHAAANASIMRPAARIFMVVGGMYTINHTTRLLENDRWSLRSADWMHFIQIQTHNTFWFAHRVHPFARRCTYCQVLETWGVVVKLGDGLDDQSIDVEFRNNRFVFDSRACIGTAFRGWIEGAPVQGKFPTKASCGCKKELEKV